MAVVVSAVEEEEHFAVGHYNVNKDKVDKGMEDNDSLDHYFVVVVVEVVQNEVDMDKAGKDMDTENYLFFVHHQFVAVEVV